MSQQLQKENKVLKIRKNISEQLKVLQQKEEELNSKWILKKNMSMKRKSKARYPKLLHKFTRER